MKIEYFNYQMIIEDTFSHYLSEKAKQGWILDHIILGYIIFKKSEPKDLKYQLEYGETDYDYDDFLKEVGYEAICVYNNIVIYKNKDIHAPDLHSDDIVRLQALQKAMNSHPIPTLLSIMLLCMPIYWILSFFLIKPLTLGGIFQYIEILPFLLLLIYIIISPIIITIQSLLLKHVIKQVANNQEPHYKILHILNKFLTYWNMPLLILYPLGLIYLINLLINKPNQLLFYIIFLTISGIIVYFTYKILAKYRVNKKAISLILFLFLIIFTGIRVNFDERFKPEEVTVNPKVTSYMKEYTSYDEHNGWLVDSHSFSYNPDDKWNADKYEIIKTCFNEYIAKEVMKNDIINYENETRASNETIAKIINKTGTYTTGDIPYYSYENAFKQLAQYHHVLVDECYYDEHFFIARQGNKILTSYMQDEDKYIDNVIEHYFK
ncbi:MAG: DUF2812 domain-containing protein [Bacilli bacterium]|nr:DUF2812 domain-containing protein [Bacilli bacterium]